MREEHFDQDSARLKGLTRSPDISIKFTGLARLISHELSSGKHDGSVVNY